MKPQPGVVYSFDFRRGGLRPINEGRPIELGARVSYEDMANPRRVFVVVSAEPGPSGYRCITEDGTHESTVSRAALDGPGGWQERPELGRATVAEVENLEAAGDAWKAHRERARAAALDHGRRVHKAGAELLEALRPPGAAAMIVAELHEDTSDLQSDYFAHRTSRVLLLGWSKHTRDLFPELRKAAALAPETEHLATAPASAEHREKWSMGAGFYLKDDSRHNSGWCVKKRPFAYAAHEVAQALATDPDSYRAEHGQEWWQAANAGRRAQ